MNYESLDEALRPLDPGSLQSVIFSNPIPSKTKYRKIRAERNGSDFFVSSFTVTQVFHETVPADRILAFCLETASDTYRQLNLWLSDGRVMDKNLRRLGYDRNWLDKRLREQGHSGPKSVFLMTADGDGNIFFCAKEEPR